MAQGSSGQSMRIGSGRSAIDGVVAFVVRAVVLMDGRRVWSRAVPSAEGAGLFADEVYSAEFEREQRAKSLPERGGRGRFAEPVGERRGSGRGWWGVMVGDCGLSGFEARKLARGVEILVLAMMCDAGWPGVGLGRVMLMAAWGWVRGIASSQPGVRRVERGVLASRRGAGVLAGAVGFAEEGRFRARFRQAGGPVVDDPAMALEAG